MKVVYLGFMNQYFICVQLIELPHFRLNVLNPLNFTRFEESREISKTRDFNTLVLKSRRYSISVISNEITEEIGRGQELFLQETALGTRFRRF